MKDPFLIIGYMLLGLMISFEANALTKEETHARCDDCEGKGNLEDEKKKENKI